MNILSAVDCGTLHIVPEDDRVLAVSDASVTDTWEEADLSCYVPNGVKALFGYIYIETTTDSRGILLIRDGASTSDIVSNTRVFRTGAAGDWGQLVILKATNGIFDYRRYSAVYEIDTFRFRLLGYYI